MRVGQTPEEIRQTLFLVGNGNMPAWKNQELYELAWENGIRPLEERALKPRRYLRSKRYRGS